MHLKCIVLGYAKLTKFDGDKSALSEISWLPSLDNKSSFIISLFLFYFMILKEWFL